MDAFVSRYHKSPLDQFVRTSTDFINYYLAQVGVEAFAVLNVIASFQKHQNPHLSHVSVRKIAELTNMGRNRARKAVKRLIEVGFISNGSSEKAEGPWRIHAKAIQRPASIYPDFNGCWVCGRDVGENLNLHLFDGNPKNRADENVCYLCPNCELDKASAPEDYTSIGTEWAVSLESSGSILNPAVVSKETQGGCNLKPEVGSKRTPYIRTEELKEEGGEDKPSPPSQQSNAVELSLSEDPEAEGILSDLYNVQLEEAMRIKNPVLRTTAFRKGKFPRSYTPYSCPKELEELGCKTMYLFATNVMVTVQQNMKQQRIVTPCTAKDVEAMGDLLASFLVDQGWSKRWAKFISWTCHNKENLAIALLPYYYPDWAAEQSPASQY